MNVKHNKCEQNQTRWTSGSRRDGSQRGVSVSLTLPGVRAARVRGHRPRADQVLAVRVDVDVAPRRAVRGVVVDALPAVGVVALQLRAPASLVVAGLALDAEVALVERAGVAGGVSRRGNRENSTDGQKSGCTAGDDLALETHDEPSLLKYRGRSPTVRL